MAQTNKIKETTGERVFNVINILFMIILIIIMIYPFWHVVMYSLSDVTLALRGGIFLWPRGFSLSSYKAVFKNRSVLSGFKVSIIVTLIGTALGIILTAAMAYPISKQNLRGNRFFTIFILITMLFGGGMIPNYLLIKKLNMLDKYSALILPGCLGGWNILVMRNFFKTIPQSLEESAKIDGANDIVVFFKIILPLSKAIIATLSLFTAVGYWNDFFSTVVYITSKDKWALQAVLREIIVSTSQVMTRAGIKVITKTDITSQSIIMATIIVATLPILIIYPFLQKHFVKGVLIGSVKG